MIRLLAALILSSTVLPLAQAETTLSCRLEESNGDVWEATFTRSDAFDKVTSKATMNGVDMPALRDCVGFVPERQRVAGWRCPHGYSELRFELYPQFNIINNKGPMMRMIRWNGEQVEKMIEVLDCK